MAHISKQLLAAVTVAITGLPSTADRVKQSRTYAHKSGPALNVRLGTRTPLATLSNSIVKAEQLVHIDIAVAGGADELDDLLLDIDAEIYRALLADYTLGLLFVEDCDQQSLSEPDVEVAERPKAVATSSWRYVIRHSRTDLEQ